MNLLKKCLLILSSFAYMFSLDAMNENQIKAIIDKHKLEKSIETLNPQAFSFTMAGILAPSAKKTDLNIIANSIRKQEISVIKYMQRNSGEVPTDFITSGALSIIQNLHEKIRDEQVEQTSEQNLKKWRNCYFSCGIFNAFVATVGIGLIFSGHQKTGIATTCAGVLALGKVGYTYKNHNNYYQDRTKKAEELKEIITFLRKNL